MLQSQVCMQVWKVKDLNSAILDSCVHAHLTSLILMTAECPILCTATTLSPRWQYLSCFATDMAACTNTRYGTLFSPD